jgi:hypothetical protein
VKRATCLLSLALIVIVALVAAGQAQETTRSITIQRESKIGDRQISKGSYTVKFDEGKDGDLVFLKGSREVAKASYAITKLNQAASDTTVIYKAGSDGTLQVSRIEFKGSDMALALK